MHWISRKTHHFISTADLETLSDSIALSIRRNMSWFDSAHVAIIKQNMNVAIDSSTSDKIMNEYRDILNRL